MSSESTLNMELLERRAGSKQAAKDLQDKIRDELALPERESHSAVLSALALSRLGMRVEDASRSLGWREFESFCAYLVRVAGFEVRENVRLKGPRAQIDLIVFASSLILTVDCKHWLKSNNQSSLINFARAQLRRNGLLRRVLRDRRPIGSAILTVSDQSARFVEGVAIVPIYALRSFLGTIEDFAEQLELS